MENKETNEKCEHGRPTGYCSGCRIDTPVVEKSGWEEDFYGLTKTMDGQYRPKLLLFIKNVEKAAYERGQGKMVIDWGVKELENARLEGKKEAEVALIAELEGRYKELVWKEEETNGEYVQKIGFNSALDLIISNLRERIQ